MRKLIAIALLAIASLASLAAFANRGNGGAVRGAAARAGMMARNSIVEVEWIGNTSSGPFIATGVVIDDNLEFEFVAQFTHNETCWGGQRSEGGDYWARYQFGKRDSIVTNGIFYSFGTHEFYTTTVYNPENKHTYSVVGEKFYIDGNYIRDNTLYQGTAKFNIFSYWINDSLCTLGSGSRCYGGWLRKNGVMLRDFVPVRDTAGNGYMLDKVTGQLFGNAGTGAFIVGPDK